MILSISIYCAGNKSDFNFVLGHPKCQNGTRAIVDAYTQQNLLPPEVFIEFGKSLEIYILWNTIRMYNTIHTFIVLGIYFLHAMYSYISFLLLLCE